MNAESIRKLFEQVRHGKITPDDAVERLRHLPFEDLGFAKVDHPGHHRQRLIRQLPDADAAALGQSLEGAYRIGRVTPRMEKAIQLL